MLDSDTPAENPATPDAPTTENDTASADPPAKKTAAKKTTAKKAAAKKTTAKKAAAKKTTKKATAADPDQPALVDTEAAAPADGTAADASAPEAPAAKKAAKKAAAKKTAAKKTAAKKTTAKKTAKKTESAPEPADAVQDGTPAEAAEDETEPATPGGALAAAPLFQPPDVNKAAPRRRKTTKTAATVDTDTDAETGTGESDTTQGDGARTGRAETGSGTRAAKASGDTRATGGTDEAGEDDESETDEAGGGRRRRRRGGRRRRKSGGGNGAGDEQGQDDSSAEPAEASQKDDQPSGDNDSDSGSGSGSSRRRRRRRRAGDDGDGGGDDPENTVTRVRKARNPEDEITALSGSTRLEAKKQRRREGREAGRRRAPIVSEAEFLARREAVERVMVIRQRKDLTQIAVLEDKVLVEHYVARESQTSLIGNVYLGKVQNVLPSMEAAFIDIGKGRNAVLYAGEVNWDALGAGNGPRKIEQVLKSGQSVLVQVSKDPVGHKGARLTSQISLPGRFLVYVPDGTTSGISRKLPDTERNRLKTLLKEIVPESAGVIVRTAAEGASEEELTHDVERLTARWEDIAAKVEKGNAPQLLYGEPDLTLKVVRDLFTEDFGKLVVSGDDAWDLVDGYVRHVAPDLAERLVRYDGDADVFSTYRIDEQIAKALDRKVWLPSGGSLIIDRTEAMTVVDVNTGKFTGSGGNLEETVTKNNLEAAEEIVRQLRLRDIGGIIVVDFIDMVLESNRDLVLRRMVECLGRDRTRHQVAEVTSLGLVQMTRKRIGTGLLEAFSETCDHCSGRGLIVHHEPVEPRKKAEEEPRRGRRTRGRGKSDSDGADGADTGKASGNGNGNGSQGQGGNGHGPSPKEFAAMAGRPSEEPTDQPVDGARPQTDKQARKRADEPTGKQADKPTDEKPVVKVNRRQRGGASSPAQPADTQGDRPAADETGAPEPVDQGAPHGSTPEPAPVQAAEPEATPAPPKVVTSSRRRVARRPAGPPAAQAAADAGDASGGVAVDTVPPGQSDQSDPAADGGADSTSSAPAHVPVKRKGSRKR